MLEDTPGSGTYYPSLDSTKRSAAKITMLKRNSMDKSIFSTEDSPGPGSNDPGFKGSSFRKAAAYTFA